MGVIDWIRRGISGIASAFRRPADDGASSQVPVDTTPAEAPEAAPSPPVQADALKQMNTAIGWLIVALGAVATAMIAGSQLSSIGQLSASTDTVRLWWAVGGAVGAVVLILIAIALLYRAQSPTNTDFARLCDLANESRTYGIDRRVRDQVAQDASLHHGTASLRALMDEVTRLRDEFYLLRKAQLDLRLQIAREGDGDQDADKKSRLDRISAQLEVVDVQLNEHLTALEGVADLDKFQRTRARFQQTAWAVVVLAAAAAFGFVAFAWAANPPKAAMDAADQRATAAQLTVFSTAADAMTARLGSLCATAAMAPGGIPVIALRSDDSGVEVVVVPSQACPQPVRFVVPTSEGTVLASPSLGG